MKFSKILEIPSRISPEMGMFCLIWQYGIFFQLNFSQRAQFCAEICKFRFFWNPYEIPEFIVEFEKIDLRYDMGCQFHLVSSTEFNFAVTNDNFTKMKELKKKNT